MSSDHDSHSRRLSTGTLARNPDIGDQALGFVAAVGRAAGPEQCVERNVIRPSTLVVDRGAIGRPASPLTAGLHASITMSLHLPAVACCAVLHRRAQWRLPCDANLRTHARWWRERRAAAAPAMGGGHWNRQAGLVAAEVPRWLPPDRCDFDRSARNAAAGARRRQLARPVTAAPASHALTQAGDAAHPAVRATRPRRMRTARTTR